MYARTLPGGAWRMPGRFWPVRKIQIFVIFSKFWRIFSKKVKKGPWKVFFEQLFFFGPFFGHFPGPLFLEKRDNTSLVLKNAEAGNGVLKKLDFWWLFAPQTRNVSLLFARTFENWDFLILGPASDGAKKMMIPHWLLRFFWKVWKKAWQGVGRLAERAEMHALPFLRKNWFWRDPPGGAKNGFNTPLPSQILRKLRFFLQNFRFWCSTRGHFWDTYPHSRPYFLGSGPA